MERIVGSGLHQTTKIVCLDEPGIGGACHEYKVMAIEPSEDNFYQTFAFVDFQNGPIKEAGVNGCFQEDLIAICIDRLRSFQAGPFACRENEIALIKLEEALLWLNFRTTMRRIRGVEGTNTL